MGNLITHQRSLITCFSGTPRLAVSEALVRRRRISALNEQADNGRVPGPPTENPYSRHTSA